MAGGERQGGRGRVVAGEDDGDHLVAELLLGVHPGILGHARRTEAGKQREQVVGLPWVRRRGAGPLGEESVGLPTDGGLRPLEPAS
jgi:hypothetical protein